MASTEATTKDGICLTGQMMSESTPGLVNFKSFPFGASLSSNSDCDALKEWTTSELAKVRVDIDAIKVDVKPLKTSYPTLHTWCDKLLENETTYRASVQKRLDEHDNKHCCVFFAAVVSILIAAVAVVIFANYQSNVATADFHTKIDALMTRIALLEQQNLTTKQADAGETVLKPTDPEPQRLPLNRKTLVLISDWLTAELKPLEMFIRMAESIQSKHGAISELDSVQTRIDTHRIALGLVDFIARRFPYFSDDAVVEGNLQLCLTCEHDSYLYNGHDVDRAAVDLVRDKLHEMTFHTLFFPGQPGHTTLLITSAPLDYK